MRDVDQMISRRPLNTDSLGIHAFFFLVQCLYSSGLSRETEPLCVCVCVCVCVYALIHAVMEAEKSYDLLSSS